MIDISYVTSENRKRYDMTSTHTQHYPIGHIHPNQIPNPNRQWQKDQLS